MRTIREAVTPLNSTVNGRRVNGRASARDRANGWLDLDWARAVVATGATGYDYLCVPVNDGKEDDGRWYRVRPMAKLGHVRAVRERIANNSVWCWEYTHV